MGPKNKLQQQLCLLLWLFIGFVFLFSDVVVVVSGISMECPNQCDCIGNVVNCANKGYRSFPIEIPVWGRLLLLQSNPLHLLKSTGDPTLKITAPTKLTEIDLTNTQLSHIDPNFFVNNFNKNSQINKSLRVLILDENQLNLFPLLNGLSNLRKLTLTDNRFLLANLRNVDLRVYPSLEMLDLSINKINSIPRHFLSGGGGYGGNLKLSVLNLEDNQITSIETGAFEMFQNLKHLQLSHNNLSVLSANLFGKVSHLEHLELNFNQISRIDRNAFDGLAGLQKLRLRRNRLKRLEDGTFEGLVGLKELFLDQNEVVDIRFGWTRDLKSLIKLTIRNNLISVIGEDSWNDTIKLSFLYLNHNRLERIDNQTFHGLTSLQELFLANNNISSIESNSFQMLPSLTDIDLARNHFSWSTTKLDGYFVATVASSSSLSSSPTETPIIPHFTGLPPPSNLTVKLGDTAKLECFVTGLPLPTIEWIKDGGSRFTAAHEHRLIMMPNKQVVMIAEVTENDIGLYTCNATNRVGSISASTFLSVSGPPSLLRTEPFTTIVALYDSTVSIDCRSHGIPSPSIVWFKNGKQLPDFTFNYRFDSNRQILTIDNLKYFDSGNYSCNVSNQYGYVLGGSMLNIVEDRRTSTSPLKPLPIKLNIVSGLSNATKKSKKQRKRQKPTQTNWFENIKNELSNILYGNNQKNIILLIVVLLDLFVAVILLSCVISFCNVRRQHRLFQKRIEMNQEKIKNRKRCQQLTRSRSKGKSNKSQLDLNENDPTMFDFEISV